MNKADVIKRRQEVKRLYFEHFTPITEIAKVMSIKYETIKKDVQKIIEESKDRYSPDRANEILLEHLNQLDGLQAMLFKQVQDKPSLAKHIQAGIDQQQKTLQRITELSNNTGTGTHPAELTFLEFNKLIGLPYHPHRNEQLELTPAQLQIHNIIPHSEPIRLCVSKARQIGISEVVLRIMLWHAFKKYKNGTIAIIAGTNQDTANELMDRMAELCRNIPGAIKHQIEGEIILNNGAKIQTASAQADSIRGLTKLRAVLLDECAFFKLKKDHKVLDTLLPIVKSNGTDLYMISTPNGTQNIHYQVMEYAKTGWTKLEIDIDQGAIGLYTEQEKQKILADSLENTEQEYYCKAITTANSFYGSADNAFTFDPDLKEIDLG